MALSTGVSWFLLLIGISSIVLFLHRMRSPDGQAGQGGREWGPTAQLALGVSFLIGSIRQLTDPSHTVALVEDSLGIVAALISIVLYGRALGRR